MSSTQLRISSSWVLIVGKWDESEVLHLFISICFSIIQLMDWHMPMPNMCTKIQQLQILNGSSWASCIKGNMHSWEEVKCSFLVEHPTKLEGIEDWKLDILAFHKNCFTCFTGELCLVVHLLLLRTEFLRPCPQAALQFLAIGHLSDFTNFLTKIFQNRSQRYTFKVILLKSVKYLFPAPQKYTTIVSN